MIFQSFLFLPAEVKSSFCEIDSGLRLPLIILNGFFIVYFTGEADWDFRKMKLKVMLVLEVINAKESCGNHCEMKTKWRQKQMHFSASFFSPAKQKPDIGLLFLCCCWRLRLKL